jgi:transcription antitermination factor NusG
VVLKLEENPPASWPEGKLVGDFAGTWRVAHTKSRNEKALAWQMQKKNISYFLPMAKKVYRQKGRTFRSLLPLFAGYVFFCCDEEGRVEVLRTNRVANIIEVRDQSELVAELGPIQIAIDEGEQLLPHKYIKTGQACRVTAGPLVGIEGIVVQTREHTRLVLQVDMLGQATSVEIAMDMIELIE